MSRLGSALLALTAVAAALAAAGLLRVAGGGPGFLVWDGAGRALGVTVAVVVAAASAALSLGRGRPGELAALLLAALAGGCAVAAAQAVEVDAVALLWAAAWILGAAATAAGGPSHLEAAIKLAGLGAAASLALFLGATFLATLSGSPHILEIGYTVAGPEDSLLLARTAMRVYLVGLAACAAWVPFHFWGPDGLSGGSVPRAAVLAVAFPLAAMVCLARVLYSFEPALDAGGVRWSGGLFAIGLLTVGYAGSVALVQRSAIRLLAYLGLARSGELLVAAVGVPGGAGELGLACVTHATALVPAWLAVAALSFERSGTVHGGRVTDFDALRGLARRAPGRGAVLLGAFALAVGAPGSSLFLWRPAAASASPNPGLWALLLVLAASLQWAAVVRLARVVVLDEDPNPEERRPAGRRVTLLWWAVALLLVFEVSLSLSHRTLGPPAGPEGRAWNELNPGF